MTELEYANQKHKIYLTETASIQFKNLKEHNWNSRNAKARELFNNVLFPRLDSAIMSLSNTDDFEDYETINGDFKIIDVSDDIASIIFQVKNTSDGILIIIERFIWTFKTVKWFKGIKEEYHNISKRRLYESIMQDVAKIVKRHINNLLDS